MSLPALRNISLPQLAILWERLSILWERLSNLWE